MSTYDATRASARWTAADAELFAHDQARPAHDAATCTVEGCWVCAAETTLGGAA